MKLAPIFSMFLIAIAALAGCASPTRVAQTKTIEAGGEKFELGGRYTPPANELILTINGDPVMRGSFPPYTPTLRLNATYKNKDFTASCYFGTILGGGFGKRSIIASSVQGGLGKGGDKCEIAVGGKSEELFF